VASILQVNGKWRAQVRKAGQKSIAKSFATKKEAEAWARRVETGLDEQRPILIAEDMTVEQLIKQYRRVRADLGRPIDATTNTHYMLEHLVEDLGTERVQDLKPARLASWAKARHKEGAGGYTVNMELSALGTAIRHTASFMQITLPDVVGTARPLLHYGQLISGGGRRTRRPTEDELTRVIEYIAERNKVVADAVKVAAITGLRRGELARIQWKDVDELRRAVLVRGRKHPRRIEAKDEWVPLLGDAWEVVKAQPRVDARIFPASREAMTDNVTSATRALGIPDLRLHDMRREATSRLREMGFDTDERKAITGHKSDAIHERYVAVTLESLHLKHDALQEKPLRPKRPRKAPARQSGSK
jgi:integrase